MAQIATIHASLVFTTSVQFKHAFPFSLVDDLSATVNHRQNGINPEINVIAQQSLASVIATHNLIKVYDWTGKLYQRRSDHNESIQAGFFILCMMAASYYAGLKGGDWRGSDA